jgi:hypothetical protein
MPPFTVKTPLAAMLIAASPLAFFAPAIPLATGDRARLDAGQTIVQVLPGDGRDLAVFAAVRTAAPAERLVAWAQQVERQRNGRYVASVGRFSSPPALDDVAPLALDDDDLNDLRRCRPGDCGLKLSAAEIQQLQQQLGDGRDWQRTLQHGFRQAFVNRASAYDAYGDAGALPYEDESDPVEPNVEFASLVQQLGFLPLHLPRLTDYLTAYPRVDHPDVVDSFLYWSTETFGVRPITSITHLTTTQGGGPGVPDALVVSKQVFATHYKDAAVSVIALAGSPASGRYLVYVHRSRVDVLDGMFGGVVRRIIERRVRGEAPGVLLALKRKLEGVEP